MVIDPACEMHMAEQLRDDAGNESWRRGSTPAIDLARGLPFEVNLWRVQTSITKCWGRLPPPAANSLNGRARWRKSFP